MTKNLSRFAVLLLTVLTFGCLAGCSNSDDVVDGVPSVEIKNVKVLNDANGNSVSFTIAPKSATGYGYACVTLEDFKTNNYTLTRVDGGETKDYTIPGLIAGGDYVIAAEAYNGKNTSKLISVRTSAPVSAPTVEVLDILPTADGISLTLKASEGSTSINYAIYTQLEADMHAEDAEDAEEWRKWESIKELNADGNVVTKALGGGDYIIEVYANAKTVTGTHIKESFSVMPQDRPYVKISMHSLTSEDGGVILTQNDKCKQYYVGLIKVADYTSEKVFSIVKSAQAANYLKTADYNGSIRELIAETSTEWAPKTEFSLWIVACNADGTYSEEPSTIIQGRFTVPERNYDETISIATLTVAETTFTTYHVNVVAQDYTEYYLVQMPKSEFDNKYGQTNDRTIIEEVLFTTPKQTVAEQTLTKNNLEPGSKHIILAAGINTKGKISSLTKLIVTTQAVVFDSPAAVTVSSIPETNNATITFAPENGCTSARYVVLTNTEYLSLYSGSASRVQNALAMQTALNMRTIDFSQNTTVKLTELVSNKVYLVFTLPIDQDGKMGPMQPEHAFTTTSFNLEGTASFALSKVTVAFVSAGNKRVTFTVTPDDECMEYYIQLIPGGVGNDTDPMLDNNELVKKLLVVSPTGSILVSGDGEAAPKYSYNKILTSDTNYYLYILCKDANGKFNNPNATRTFVKMK